MLDVATCSERSRLRTSKVHHPVFSKPCLDHHAFVLQVPRLFGSTARVETDHFAVCGYNSPEWRLRFGIFGDRHHRTFGQERACDLSIGAFRKCAPEDSLVCTIFSLASASECDKIARQFLSEVPPQRVLAAYETEPSANICLVYPCARANITSSGSHRAFSRPIFPPMHREPRRASI